MRWGLENLDLTAARLKELGFEGMLQPIKVTCARPRGHARQARIQQWDGAKWNVVSDWYQSDDKVIKPMVEAAAKKYADGEEDHRPRLLEGELSPYDARATFPAIGERQAPCPSPSYAGGREWEAATEMLQLQIRIGDTAWLAVHLPRMTGSRLDGDCLQPPPPTSSTWPTSR